MPILAKFYGREVDEFAVFNSQEEYDYWLKGVELVITNGDNQWYYGNMYEYFDTIEDITRSISTQEITHLQADVLTDLVDGTGMVFGHDLDLGE